MSEAIFTIAGVTLAAFCLWLAVRIFNRRERWAKRMAIGLLIVVLVVYPLSIGPACWLAGDNETALTAIPNAYYPILWVARLATRSTDQGKVNDCVEWYATLGRSDGAWPYLAPMGEKRWAVHPDPEPDP